MHQKQHAVPTVAGAKVTPTELVNQSLLQLADRPALRDFYFRGHARVGGPSPQADIGLLFIDHVRLALDRIGAALLQTQPFGDPVLDCSLTVQPL